MGDAGGTEPRDDATLPPPSTRAACDPSGWRVTASPSAAGNAPGNAIDGLPTTRWSTGKGQGPGQYLQIDFGGWLTLSRLALDSGGASAVDYLRGYELLASKDGVTFEQVIASGTQSLPPQGGIQIVDFFATAMQALRIDSIQPSGNWWSVYELNVDCYGSDSRYDDALRCHANDNSAGGAGSDASPVSDRAHWSATAARKGDREQLQAAFDGDLSTSWSTGAPQTSTDWFQLDLGEVACISNVSFVCPEGATPNAYTIELSEDAINYVQVAEGLGSDGMVLAFAAHSARFVRVNQIGSGASNSWSIQEVRVGP
ncbi:MAG TPA: discoidin domain-containing protein [Polyangiaceae bacterium]|nr:discoidin domain-containing protein [Polyangiaceae bacterium]